MLNLSVFEAQILAAIAQKSNALFSPLSMYIALAMLHKAVESKALEDHGDFDESAIEIALGIPVSLSNSVNWTPDIRPNTEYAGVLSNLFHATTGEEEMDNPPKVLIENVTHLLEKWSRPFKTTSEGEFEGVPCVYMHDTADYDYFENDKVQSLRKPLKNRLNVRIVLPKEGVELKEAFDTMTQRCYHRHRPVELTMPKISFEHKSQWNELAAELIGEGLPSFTMKDGSPLLIKDVEITQKSKIKLDKEGVEAKAVTTIVVFCLSAASDDEEEEPIVMDVDRPFFIAIEDYSQTPLFIGVVFKPEA